MLGKKVTLQRSTDDGSTYGDAIADVIEIDNGSTTAETEDVTPYDGGDDWREHEYGLKDGGEMSITTLYKASQTDIDALEDAHNNSTVEYLRLVYPAPISKNRDYKCLITEVGEPIPKGNQIQRTFTIKRSGKPTKTAIVV